MLKDEDKETEFGDTSWKVGSKKINIHQSWVISMLAGIDSNILRYRKTIKSNYACKNSESGHGHALRQQSNYLCPVFMIRCINIRKFLFSHVINNYVSIHLIWYRSTNIHMSPSAGDDVNAYIIFFLTLVAKRSEGRMRINNKFYVCALFKFSRPGEE